MVKRKTQETINGLLVKNEKTFTFAR